jgi:hypothetical protein
MGSPPLTRCYTKAGGQWTRPPAKRIIQAVNAFQRFEDWLARLLEDGLASHLGAAIQPVDIAKRLAEHMEDHRTVGAGRRYVSNHYRVYLNPRTLASFATYQSALEDELAAFLSARARELDFHFLGRVRVALLPDEKLRPERMRIEADLIDRHQSNSARPHHVTQALDVPHPPPAPPAVPPAAVLAVGGRRVLLNSTVRVTLGRALDNDVVIDDSTVSRHHARLVAHGQAWQLEDLGSTNGSFVNEQRVATGFIRCGDVIRLGSVALVLAEAEELPPK